MSLGKTAWTPRQTTHRVLMVRPASFGFDPETAATNRYQVDAGGADVAARARDEFDGFVAALRGAGVEVLVAEDPHEPRTPDAVFPNNWLSLHADGTAVLYPMHAPARRREVRPELLQWLHDEHGLSYERVLDLTRMVEDGEFLEGTGSLVLDRVNRLAYACRSPRTTERALTLACELLGYEPVAFRAEDDGIEIYHTNVLMGIGPDWAAVCLEALPDARERALLRARLEDTGHRIVALRLGQMRAFAGNLLALESSAGAPRIVLSARGWAALDEEQREVLASHGRLVQAHLPTIETVGGGSARCMIAEVFAPPT